MNDRIRAMRQEVRQRDVVDVETRRLMDNWVRWKASSPIGLALSGAYALEARGRREGTSMPLFDWEASDVDQAIDQLPIELKVVTAQYWLRKGTIREKLHRCRCSAQTFYRRLEHAHGRIRQHLQILRNRRTRLRKHHEAKVEKPANGGKTPLSRENECV